MSHTLAELSLLQITEETKSPNSAVFTIEPLSPGFGLTIANALRRVLLSALEGAAITSIRIDGVTHEFASIKGIRQDVVDIILNLKQVRFKMDSEEPQVILLDVKSKKIAKAGDFKCPTGVEVVNTDLVIADVVEGGKLLIEATVERSHGYLPTELRKEDKLPIGVIAIDASFSPIERVNYQVENTRVGKMTNFDKLIMEIDTDGTMTPKQALEAAGKILVDHFAVVGGQVVNEVPSSDAIATAEKSVEEIDAELSEEKPKKAAKPAAEKAKKSPKATK